MEKPDKNNHTSDLSEDMGLGSLLRTTREEHHIDLDEVAKVTRIRRCNLEALENEEWAKLPIPVFAKGFLRTYAGFLGLDQEMVLGYYAENAPSQEHQPHVLEGVSTHSAKWRLGIVIALAGIAFVAAFLYLRNKNISIVETAFEYLEPNSTTEKRETVVQQKESMNTDNESNEESLEKEAAVVEQEPEAAAVPETVVNSAVSEESTISTEVKDEKPLLPGHTLKATVLKRTWVALCVDDEPVREYLFQPGETMTWTADKGFELLVGNAGGIELSLDKEILGPLGPEGKVVRVGLPQGYEGQIMSKLKRRDQ